MLSYLFAYIAPLRVPELTTIDDSTTICLVSEGTSRVTCFDIADWYKNYGT